MSLPTLPRARKIPRVEQGLAAEILARSERFAQRRIVRRDRIIHELALTRRHVGAGIEEGAPLDPDACAGPKGGGCPCVIGRDLFFLRRRAGGACAGSYRDRRCAKTGSVNVQSHRHPPFLESSKDSLYAFPTA